MVLKASFRGLYYVIKGYEIGMEKVVELQRVNVWKNFRARL